MGPDTNAMQITAGEDLGEHVVTLSGHIGTAEIPELRARLLEAVEDAANDVLIDTHRVGVFDDAALTVLTAARKRSRFLRHRVAVLDSEDSVVATSLRRTGMHIRMPVFPDVASASRSLAAGREARSRLTLSDGHLPSRDSVPGKTTAAG